MKQNRVNGNKRKCAERPSELTRTILTRSQRASEKLMEQTHSIIEKSIKLRTPAAKTDKIGTAISGLAGVVCVGVGVVQVVSGKPLWAVGTLPLGVIALISNRIHYHQIRRKED